MRRSYRWMPHALVIAVFLSLALFQDSPAAAQEPVDLDYEQLQRFFKLWYAVNGNDPAAVKAAHDAGIGVNGLSPVGGYIQPGLTALHFAVKFEALDAAEMLLKCGADVEGRSHSNWGHGAYGQTPMHFAVRHLLGAPAGEHREKAVRFIELLLRHMADINAADDAGRTPLHCAATHYVPAKEAVDLLLAKGARLDIHAASALGDVERVKALLDESPTLARHQLTDGATPLHFAAKMGRHEVAKLLLEAGAVVEARDGAGQTPLHVACEGFVAGQPKVVALLLEKTRAIDARDNQGRTPLHYAVKYWGSQTDIPQQLLDRGANANARDDGDLTPLHVAAYWGDGVPVCELLLKHGADIGAKNRSGDTPASLAELRPGHPEVAEFLRKQSARP